MLAFANHRWMGSMLSLDEVQAAVTSYWNYRASSYDRAAGHDVHSAEERRVWLETVATLLPEPPADVLDVGTGTGFLALLAAELGHRVVGIDLAERMLARAQEKAAQLANPPAFRLGDAVAPPFEATRFDVVASRHLLWTLRDPEKAFREWYRVLRPGGRVVAIDAFWFSTGCGRNTNDDDEEERRRYWDRYYNDEVQRRLPLMRASSVEPILKALEAAGFVRLEVHLLEQIRKLEAQDARETRYAVVAAKPGPPSPEPSMDAETRAR